MKSLKYMVPIVIGMILILIIGINPNNTSTSDKTLIVGKSSDALGLDPSVATDYETFQISVNLYETLVKFNTSGSELLPGLAESWTVSEDGMRWVFKIREHVTFHDGTDLNAQAVAFNFNRWMDMDSPYHAGHFSYWQSSFGGFPGIVKSVNALSDFSLEIILSEPFSPFLSILTQPAFGIASPDAIIKYNESLKYNPVGTGPFIFESWTQGEEIVLSRNTNYWDVKPKLTTLIFKVIPAHVNKEDLLTSGQVHIIDNINQTEIDAIKKDTQLKLYYRPYFNVAYLALNNQKEPFDNLLVRKAISHLIDKERLIDASQNSLTRAAKTFIPPVLMGYHEGLQTPEYNVELAKGLLDEAGYENGFETTLWVMDQSRGYISNPIGAAKFIQSALSKADIKVNLRIMSWDTYLESIKLGEHPMALVGWNGDIIDPDNFLNTFFSSGLENNELTLNYAFYENTHVNRLLLQARTINDSEFRISLYREIQEIISSDVVSIPLMHSMTALATDRSVLNFEPHVIGMETFNHVDLLIDSKEE